MPPQRSPTKPSTIERELPAEWVRTAVSFMLFLHFFAIAVAVLSNWDPSSLALGLRNVPLLEPYVEALALDRSYLPQYALTIGEPEDTDDEIQLELQLADGSLEHETIPQATLWPHAYRRQLRLAETVTDLVGENTKSFESFLPRAVAAHFVAAAERGSNGEPGQEVTGGTIRIHRHLVQTMTAPASSIAAERDPYDESRYQTIYEARILLVGGEVQLLKSDTAANVAPAAVKKKGE